MPSEFEARRQIVEIGRRIWERGYVAANDGNLSVRLPGDRILVTPTGRSKGFLKPEELALVDLDGRPLSGPLPPTSELPMHLFVYRRRADVGAVVHAHPPRATGFAAAGVPLAQCILPEVILTLGCIPLTSYATPSTHEVPQSIEEFIDRFNALLLRNHGVLTLGDDVERAYYRLETVEHFAHITLTTKLLGGAAPLGQEEIRKLLSVRESLGLGAVPEECVSCGACEPGSAPGTATTQTAALPATAATPSDATAERAAGASPRPPDEEEIVRAVIAEVERAMRKG